MPEHVLVAAAKYLKAHEAELRGTVKLLFQPAEEGGAGAKVMIEEGALQGVSAVFGLHVWPTAPSGHILTRVRPLLVAPKPLCPLSFLAQLGLAQLRAYKVVDISLQTVAFKLQFQHYADIQVGTLMAGTDKFYIRINGVGGHGGTPHLVKDTVVAASAVVMNLQPLVSRETDPAEGGIIGVTLINSGKRSLLTVTWCALFMLDIVG